MGRFTLVELLVVTVIIAILTSLLLPALSAARAKGQAAVCLANVRQFAVALPQYADEYDDYWPMAGYNIWGGDPPPAPWRHPNWSGAVAHYTSTTYYTEFTVNPEIWPECQWVSYYSELRNDLSGYILKCPADTIRNPWGGVSAVSYGYNAGPMGLGASDGFDQNPYYTVDHPIYNHYYGRIRSPEIATPSTTILAGDFINVDSDQRYEYQIYQLKSPDQLGAWHGGRTNIVWIDGHASSESYETMAVNDDDDAFWDYWNREQ